MQKEAQSANVEVQSYAAFGLAPFISSSRSLHSPSILLLPCCSVMLALHPFDIYPNSYGDKHYEQFAIASGFSFL